MLSTLLCAVFTRFFLPNMSKYKKYGSSNSRDCNNLQDSPLFMIYGLLSCLKKNHYFHYMRKWCSYMHSKYLDLKGSVLTAISWKRTGQIFHVSFESEVKVVPRVFFLRVPQYELRCWKGHKVKNSVQRLFLCFTSSHRDRSEVFFSLPGNPF